MLHVITGLGVGGAEAMLASLVTAESPGIEHSVVSLLSGGFHAARIREHGVDVLELALNRPTRAPLAITALARWIRKVQPDVVQGWMYQGNVAALAAATIAGERRRMRLVWGIRCSGLELSREGLQLRAVIRASARLSPFADVLVANSHTGLEDHVRQRFRTPRQLVIHNGIDTVRFRPDTQARAELRAALGLRPSEVVVAHVGRVHPMKDHATFIEAMRDTSGIKALVIGAGTEDLPDLPNVLRLGRRSDVGSLLAAADVVASSSAYGEGFSNAIAEGMAVGLVPIATDTGDARVLVGDTGQVVPVRSAAALSAALRQAASLTPGDLVERGKRARERICANFSLEACIQRFTHLYRELSEELGSGS